MEFMTRGQGFILIVRLKGRETNSSRWDRHIGGDDDMAIQNEGMHC